MIVRSTPEAGVSLILIEGCLTAIMVAVAFAFPRLGSAFFSYTERSFRRLANRKGLSVAVVGSAAFLLRLAILPLCPVPLPFVPDDFSFLLAANTFASGRLTNITPAMWVHFETIHITMKPTYMSMYFPAQGLTLAAGKILTGHAWYGVLFMSAMMCAAICWMLQAWLPASWALLGGILAILRLCLFSYWTNTYSGGGSIAALGGALVLGALPRLMKDRRLRDGVLMASGMILLALCRPFEGILLCIPVAFVLGRSLLFGSNRLGGAALLRLATVPMILMVAAGSWIGYYNFRAFGSPTTPPYSVDRNTYAMAPYFIWQSPRPEPVYRHSMMRKFYYQDELNDFSRIHRWSGLIPQNLLKAARGILFYSGLVLLVPLIMLRRVLLDRRVRFLVLCCFVLAAGMLIEIFLIPHYISPFTAAFYAIGLQAMRHLRVWKPEGQPVGLALVRLTVTLCVLLGGIRVFAEPLHLSLPVWPAAWASEWYGPSPSGRRRARIEAELERLPGRQLVLVRYSPEHDPLVEWIYNSADIDHSKVIWAWDMGPAENRELIRYYKDRNVWLVQPDLQPVGLSPYPMDQESASSAQASSKVVASVSAQRAQEVNR